MLRPYSRVQANRPRVVIRLLTNQPITDELRENLTELRTALTRSAGSISAILGRVRHCARITARTMKTALGMSWQDLANLIRCWDLSTFGQPSLFISEARLFQDFAGAYPDSSLRLAALFGQLQSASTPHQRVQLDRATALAALQLMEGELFPAPSRLDDTALFATAASRALLSELNDSDGIVALHGRRGIGKTSDLLVALRELGTGVLYDCYAGGQGLRPGQERFEYPVCFVQIINELEERFHTGLFATTRLAYRPLMNRLAEAVSAAAEKAGQVGKRLVLAFDAVDDAVEQQRRTVGETQKSFVEMLWDFAWPPNCAVVVSFRSENEREVLSSAAGVRLVEIHGFTEPEFQQLAATHDAIITGPDLHLLWERTAGNPRVAAKILDEVATSPSAYARTVIETTARLDAFAYYDQEQEPGRRIADQGARLLLAVLYEMRQPPSLGVLAQATRESPEDVRERLARLRLGLRVVSDDTIEWVDRDFLDWVGQRLATECIAARSSLADFCADQFQHIEYARWNLSYHFLLAKRYQQILEWWALPGRLEAQRATAQPHEERMLSDLHALVLASLELGRDEDALLWLFRAGDLAGGRDAFAITLAGRLDIAVAADLVGLIDGEIRGGSMGPRTGRAGSVHSSRRIWHHDATSDFKFAAALAAHPDRREDAERIFARAVLRHREEEARLGKHARGPGLDDWEQITRYRVRVGSLAKVLHWVSRDGASPWALEMALTAANDWVNANEPDPLAVIASARLPAAIKAAACLGVLSARHPDCLAGTPLREFPHPAVETAAASIERALRQNAPLRLLVDQSDFPRYQVTTALVDAAEQLLAAGFVPEVRRLTGKWCPRLPGHWADWSIREFLRWSALKEASGGGGFDPSTYELPTRKAGTEGERKRETERLREIMGVLYPPLQLRADAWAGRDCGAMPARIRETLSDSVIHMRPGQIAHGASPLTAASWLLAHV